MSFLLGCPPVSVRNEPERAALFFATAAASTTKADAGLAITARMHILAARTSAVFLFLYSPLQNILLIWHLKKHSFSSNLAQCNAP
jgi:hypothetical protein